MQLRTLLKISFAHFGLAQKRQKTRCPKTHISASWDTNIRVFCTSVEIDDDLPEYENTNNGLDAGAEDKAQKRADCCF